ncbi:serine protease [Listeria monocytogenes]|nr:serine protease [Listeria monocytogenes]GAT41525.1 serine protease [Listeria monocytogenes]
MEFVTFWPFSSTITSYCFKPALSAAEPDTTCCTIAP